MSTLHRKKLYARTKRTFRHMSPVHFVKARQVATIVRRFAEKLGLVYFGTVHQNDDDHRLVRGHTVSHTHRDNHYSVGSVRGYDVALVLRNDVVLTRKTHKEQRCHWLILTVDLHTKSTLPHFYIGHRNRLTVFESSFEQLAPLYVGGLLPYSHHFLDEYAVYGRATHTLEIERCVTPQVAEVIVSHFDHASVEVEDNTLYLYVESPHPDEAQLEKLLSNGLWLAEAIDTNLAALYCDIPENK